MPLVRTYPSPAAANAALLGLPGATYMREEREGIDWTVVHPGNAIDRIRARGVHTEAPVVVLTMRSGASCVPVPLVVTPASGVTPQTYVPRTVAPGVDALAVTLTRGEP